MTDQIEALLDSACDGTSYADTSAASVSSSVRTANMFLRSFYETDRRNDVYLVSEARERLAEARQHAETTLRLILQAEQALDTLGEAPKVEQLMERVALDMSVVKAIPQQPQVQTVLNNQLRALTVLASRFGLYDAGDYIRRALVR